MHWKKGKTAHNPWHWQWASYCTLLCILCIILNRPRIWISNREIESEKSKSVALRGTFNAVGGLRIDSISVLISSHSALINNYLNYLTVACWTMEQKNYRLETKQNNNKKVETLKTLFISGISNVNNFIWFPLTIHNLYLCSLRSHSHMVLISGSWIAGHTNQTTLHWNNLR